MQDFKSEMSDIDNFAPFMSVPSILHYIKYLRKSIEAEKELKSAFFKELLTIKNQLELAEAEKADLKAEIQRLRSQNE